MPSDAKWRMTILFDPPFEIIDEPKPQPKGSLTLAQQVARYHQMMDARAPQVAITISLPIFIDRVPIEKKKGTYNRASTIEWIQEKLKAAGWDPWRELGLHHRNPIGPLAVTICSAALPPPKGLSKRGQAALEVDETVWRTGSPQAGALGDIVIEAMGLQRTQIVRLIVEKVYGRAPITTIMIEPLKT